MVLTVIPIPIAMIARQVTSPAVEHAFQTATYQDALLAHLQMSAQVIAAITTS
jgi:hypothetical protein